MSMLSSLKRFIGLLIKTSAIVFVGISTAFATMGGMLVILMMVGAGIAMATIESPETAYDYHAGKKDADKKLVSIPINGLILGSTDEVSPLFSLFSDISTVYGYDIKAQLLELADDESIGGVILEINSPGGTIYGSQAIADGVAEYKARTSKPVYAFVSSMAASGGYWVAASADTILADVGTVTGSIGVISGPYKHYQDVIGESSFGESVETTGGITSEYISAGKFKDLGNPYRALSDEERASLQNSVNDSYATFINHVTKHRPITETTLRQDLGALIFSEDQALKVKLIDGIANRDQAYNQLASKAGFNDEKYQVVRLNEGAGLFETFAGVNLKTMFRSAANQSSPAVARFSFCQSRSTAMAFEGNAKALCQ